MRAILSAQIKVFPNQPKHLSAAHWNAIVQEHKRLVRADSADDLGEIIGQCKCLVESISRVVLEIDGHPADSNTSYSKVVKDAHALLVDTRTEGNDIESAGRTASTQISKIVRDLGEYRNSTGSGHGRAFLPEIRKDTACLIASSALSWSHWALPRLNDFAYGRPESLIHDLIGDNATFYSGTLTERLKVADLPKMEPRHQREVGIAVARRAMQQTFVVAQDGVESCADSNLLDFWTEEYRVGIVTGLFQNKNGEITVTKWGVQQALLTLMPVEKIADSLQDINNLLQAAGLKAKLALSAEDKAHLMDVFDLAESNRTGNELLAIQNLRHTLGVPIF